MLKIAWTEQRKSNEKVLKKLETTSKLTFTVKVTAIKHLLRYKNEKKRPGEFNTHKSYRG